MPTLHGSNYRIHMEDTAGASQNVGGDFNNVTFSWTRDNPDTTTFSKDSIQRMAGLRDATVSVTALWNNAANGATCIFGALMPGSTITRVKLFPAGSTTGCTFWTACFLPSKYEEVAPVNGPMAANYELQLASGSISASTV